MSALYMTLEMQQLPSRGQFDVFLQLHFLLVCSFTLFVRIFLLCADIIELTFGQQLYDIFIVFLLIIL